MKNEERERPGSRSRSRRARGERKGRGIVSVLLGTLLLAVLGFGLGIAAGLVLEEPKLLLDYLTGRTTSAPLEAAREARDRPPAGPTPLAEASAPADPIEPTSASTTASDAAQPAAVHEPGRARAEEPTPAVASPPPADPPVAKAPPAAAEADAAAVAEAPAPAPRSGGYSVQVGALADAASAEQLAGKLRKRGFAVYVAPSAEAGAKRWRVRVGPVATREEAQALATRLESEKFPTWVLAEGPR